MISCFQSSLHLFKETITILRVRKSLIVSGLFLCCAGFPLFTVPNEAALNIRLEEQSSSYELNEGIEYLLDLYGDLTAEKAFDRKEEFATFPKKSIQIPRTGVMWLLFSLENNSSKESWVIENAMNVELMELFLRNGGNWDSRQRSGNLVPFNERSLKTRHPAFEIHLQPGEQKFVLIRLFDHQSSSVKLIVKDMDFFRRTYNLKTLILGLAFGFFAALIVYNLIVFFLNKERVYLLYSLYMTAFFFNQFAQERLFSQLFAPNHPYGFFWFILFGSATAALGVEFFRAFIETKNNMPRIDLFMRMLRNVTILLGLSAFFYSGPLSADILNGISLIAMAFIFTALILRIIKKDILALVCLLGSFLYLAGTTTEILVTLVPMVVTSFILNAQLFGALAQVLFLGFALGAKTHKIRQEYERIQKRFREDLEQQVFDRTRELEAANEKLAFHAITDPLTGLYNRNELNRRAKEFDTFLERRSEESSTYVLSVAYLDLDNFKYCNDTYGHKFGDSLLRKTAELLRSNTRGYDLLFRLGGDEFLIIMPETDIKKAEKLIDRIRVEIGKQLNVSEDTEVTASIGLSSSRENKTHSVHELIHQADTALLASKEKGKNRVSSDTGPGNIQ